MVKFDGDCHIILWQHVYILDSIWQISNFGIFTALT